MKHLFLPFCLLLASCGSDGTDPKPVARVSSAAPATYTDAAGKQTSLGPVRVLSVTATPGAMGPRRALVVRAQLPNGSTLDVTYNYAGSSFPAPGPVAVDADVRVDNYTLPASNPLFYPGSAATVTLRVESSNPQVISGTYAGPLVSGGPAVKFAFDKAAT